MPYFFYDLHWYFLLTKSPLMHIHKHTHAHARTHTRKHAHHTHNTHTITHMQVRTSPFVAPSAATGSSVPTNLKRSSGLHRKVTHARILISTLLQGVTCALTTLLHGEPACSTTLLQGCNVCSTTLLQGVTCALTTSTHVALGCVCVCAERHCFCTRPYVCHKVNALF